MHERIMNGLRKIDQVVDKVVGNFVKEYPTLENLQANFPHKQDCGGSLPLQDSKGVLLSANLGMAGLYSERISRLSCDECHEAREYLQHE